MSAPATVVLCTAGYDHTIGFWEATTGKCYRSLKHSDSQVNCLEITPDKQLLAAAGNPKVHLYEINTNMPNPVSTFDGHSNNVTAVGFQKDRKWMYTGSEDGTVKIWDIRTPSYQRDYHEKTAVNTVTLHPNQGELLVGYNDGVMRVWDLTANRCSFEFIPDGSTPVRSISVASDASIVTMANNKGYLFAWRLNSIGDILTSAANGTSAGIDTDVTPVGTSAAVTSPASLFEPLIKVEAHNTHILKCVISPDVKLLATCSADRTVKIWNVDPEADMDGADDDSSARPSAGDELDDTVDKTPNAFDLQRVLEGHSRWVWDCDFSADSAYLVTASSDTTARLWDVSSGETILEYKNHHVKALTCAALNDSSE